VAFDLVPVRSLDGMARAHPNGEAFAKVFGDSSHPAAYVYTREVAEAGHHFHARMFAPSFGIGEDPATGSAAAAFAGALMQFEPLGNGTHSFVIEQGYEMGRPSQIALQIVIQDGALASAEIGGAAVVVSRGELFA
jgi:trans-2,3-dihydro-3-hydroxyanthranilate isomerase